MANSFFGSMTQDHNISTNKKCNIGESCKIKDDPGADRYLKKLFK